MLNHLNTQTPHPTLNRQTLAGIPVHDGAHLVLTPRFACSLTELRDKLSQTALFKVSARSTLVLDAPQLSVNRLEVDGTLVVKGVQGMCR
jgi:hypothetical protein